MKQIEAMKLALERLQARTDTADLDAMAALNDAIAEAEQSAVDNGAENAIKTTETLADTGFDGGEQVRPYEIEWPEYHEHAMGCGLEDRDEHCRYGAMRYGWDCAIEAVAQAIPAVIYTTPPPRQPEQPVAYRCWNNPQNADGTFDILRIWVSTKPEGYGNEPLYTAPPPSQPEQAGALTLDELKVLQKSRRCLLWACVSDSLLRKVAPGGHSNEEVYSAMADGLKRICEKHSTPRQPEPVSHQYQGRDGKWRDFIDEKHRASTIADGTWPIRALYTEAPPPRQPLTPAQKIALAEDWFAEDWAITKAVGMMAEFEIRPANGITKAQP